MIDDKQKFVEDVKTLAVYVAPYATLMLVGFIAGRKSVKIPPEVFPTRLDFFGDDTFVTTMSNGAKFIARLDITQALKS